MRLMHALGSEYDHSNAGLVLISGWWPRALAMAPDLLDGLDGMRWSLSRGWDRRSPLACSRNKAVAGLRFPSANKGRGNEHKCPSRQPTTKHPTSKRSKRSHLPNDTHFEFKQSTTGKAHMFQNISKFICFLLSWIQFYFPC
jgi:hypothetical protein